MFCIFYKGNPVPEWLEKVTPISENDPEYIKPTVTFQRTVVVYKRNDTFIVKPVTGFGKNAMIKISNGNNFEFAGQSKNGVHLDTKPLLSGYVMSMILLTVMSVISYLNI